MKTNGSGLVVVAGEALIDLVPGQKGAIDAFPGGGPFNTARTIARLGQPAAFLGCLSTDRFGSLLRDRLSQDGVSTEFAVGTDAATTLALADIDAEGKARYRFYNEGTSASQLDLAATKTVELCSQLEALHVGSLALAMEPIGSAVEALINMIADDALLIVDPNCRPWAVTHEAEYRVRLRRILRRADAVKLSEEDLSWLAPGIPLPQAAEGLLAAGPSVLLLTCGPRGAVILTASESIQVASPTVHAVDTIGAGDAFGGAFLAWWRAADLGRQELSDLDQLRSATEFACEVAARTCLQPGAQPPRLVDLEEENLVSRFGFGAVPGRERRT